VPRRSSGRLLLLVLLAALSVASATVGASSTIALEANEPSVGSQLWNMQVIGAPTAWRRGFTGKGVTIAVVDSGVDASHEDLTANMAPGRDFTAPNTPPDDDNGHGTHVAGIAAATAGNGIGVAGVAPEARIMPVKVLGSTGAGVADIDEAIRWSVDQGARVVNLSLGDITDPIIPGGEGSYLDGIEYAWSKGAICVVASGNTYGLDSSYGDVPAVLVAATTRTDGIASYSNRVGRARWALAAPGGSGGEPDGVLSTYWFEGESNAYAYNSGTSMAAPHVAGALALLLGAGLSPQAAVDRVLATAKDLGPPGPDDDFGRGRLDVARAVEGLTAPGQTSSSGSGSGGATAPAPTPTGAAPANPSTQPPTTRRTPVASGGATTPPTTAPAVAPPGSDTTAAPPASDVPTLSDVQAVEPADAAAAPRSRPDDGRAGPSALLLAIAALGVLAVGGAAAWRLWPGASRSSRAQ